MLEIKPAEIMKADVVVERGQALVRIVADDPESAPIWARGDVQKSDLGPVTFWVPLSVLEMVQRKLDQIKVPAK